MRHNSKCFFVSIHESERKHTNSFVHEEKVVAAIAISCQAKERRLVVRTERDPAGCVFNISF